MHPCGRGWLLVSDNEVTITGNLAADPELRFVQNGSPVANFRVISSSRQFDRAANEWRDGPTIAVRVEAWNELAEHVAESLTKGTRVVVRGRLSQRTYEGRDGVERSSVELRAEDVAVSLRWATVHVERKRRDSGQGTGSPGPQGGGPTASGGGYVPPPAGYRPGPSGPPPGWASPSGSYDDGAPF